MRTGHYLGVDVGRTRNHTALVLVRVTLPAGEDATGQPTFEVVDVRRRRGVSFEAVVLEAEAIYEDLGGDVTVAVDRAGVGAGLWDMILAANLPAFGVHATGGGAVRRRGFRVDASKSRMYSEMVGTPLHQGRLLIPRGRGDLLAEELGAVAMETTDSGNVTYTSPNKADGSHGDCVSALAMALTVAWSVGRHWVQARRVARQGQPARERPARPRSANRAGRCNTARRELDRIMEQRRQHHLREFNKLYDPLHVLHEVGIDPDDGL